MLSQQHRRSIHQKLAPIVGEEEVEAMLSEFPSSKSDAPVTNARFDVTMAEFRVEMHDLGRQMIMWSTGSIIAGMSIAATIGVLFGG